VRRSSTDLQLPLFINNAPTAGRDACDDEEKVVERERVGDGQMPAGRAPVVVLRGRML